MEAAFCGLLLYVTLVYSLLLWKAWLRAYRSVKSRRLGRKSLIRLQTCAFEFIYSIVHCKGPHIVPDQLEMISVFLRRNVLLLLGEEWSDKVN